jgi:hypothetical protein
MASRLPITNSKRATIVDVKPPSPPEPAVWQSLQHEVLAGLKISTPPSAGRDGARNALLRRSLQTEPFLHSDLLKNSSEESLEAEQSPLFRKAPPSRSPFTAPLQTIKSENVLPCFSDDGGKRARDSMDVTDHAISSSKNDAVDEIKDTSNEHDGHASRKMDDDTQVHALPAPTNTTTVSFASNTSDERPDPRTSPIEKAAVAATYIKRGEEVMTDQNTTNVEDQQSGLQASGSLSKWSTSSRSDGSPPGGSRIMRRVSGTIKRVRTPMGFHQEAQHESPKGASPRSMRTRKAGLKATRDRPRSPFPLQGASPRSKKEVQRDSPATGDIVNLPASSDNVAPSVGLGLSVNEPAASQALNESNRGRARDEDSTARVGSLPREHSRSRLVLSKINHIFSGGRGKKATTPPVPTIPPHLKRQKTRDSLRDKTIAPRKSTRTLNAPTPQPQPTTPSPRLVRKPLPPKSSSPSLRAPLTKNPSLTALPPRTSSMTTHPSFPPSEPSFPLPHLSIDNSRALTSRLIQIAQSEPSPAQRERLFHFASILTDAVIQAREAEISAETAAAAARSAAISHQMTVTAVEMIGKLVGGLGLGERKG